MIRWSFFLSLILCARLAADYQPGNEQPPEPAREFRAAWVASVWNIDWPSSPNDSAAAQRDELTRILDQAAALNLNAIVLQVRSECDALYDSKIEPWSYWLTAKQGRPPGDGIDPLPRAIEEAHARGIEVHAWFNPFRARANSKPAAAANHVTRQHPEWLLPAGGQVWLDPGLREVQDRAIAVMADVAARYDVDGIHIDDYFYPYPKRVGSEMRATFDDSKTFQKYRSSGGKLGVSDWRRSQIDGFIERLSRAVHRARPAVKFGVSPFGIHRPGHPKSIEADLDAYEHLAADSRKWLQEGWVDYLSPQLYWRINDTPHSFRTLVKWWADQNTKQRHFWPGIASSRIGPSDRGAGESIDQIELAREFARTQTGSGHIHWSWSAIGDNKDGLRQKLVSGPYSEQALVPESPWLANGGWRNDDAPRISTTFGSGNVVVRWERKAAARWWVVQIKTGGVWRMERILGGKATEWPIPGAPDVISVRAADAFGQLSPAGVLRKR
ncbi:MAG: uncharacterized lipoprotein YddW (UPF0748 family) [Verrucomicrobiales bacterium]|jgi:uncharacterized lipoprotein YddW (UPF0748 family)